MKDIQLYQQILGVEVPWQVESVRLKPEAQEIEVRVAKPGLKVYAKAGYYPTPPAK